MNLCRYAFIGTLIVSGTLGGVPSSAMSRAEIPLLCAEQVEELGNDAAPNELENCVCFAEFTFDEKGETFFEILITGSEERLREAGYTIDEFLAEQSKHEAEGAEFCGYELVE